MNIDLGNAHPKGLTTPSVSRWRPAADMPLLEILAGITAADGFFANSSDDDAPTWVECVERPSIAAALADHYGGIPTTRPDTDPSYDELVSGVVAAKATDTEPPAPKSK